MDEMRPIFHFTFIKKVVDTIIAVCGNFRVIYKRKQIYIYFK